MDNKLQVAYARLLGLRRSIRGLNIIQEHVGIDYNSIIAKCAERLEDAEDFTIPDNCFFNNHQYGRLVATQALNSKLEQVIEYISNVHNVGNPIVEVGGLFNSIKDSELKERCSDLLTAKDHFDRAINQATQILEDRIRKKAGVSAKLSGVQLVNEVLKAEETKTVLRVSNDKDEHEGVCHMCRGIMQAFRNPTHHLITDKFSREDALKVCAFIDNLLSIIDNAEVRKAH